MRNRLLWVLPAALLLGLAAWQGIALASSAQLVWPGDGGGAVTLRETIAEHDYSFGGMALCVAKGDSVTVSEVSPVNAKGLTVTAFAIREHVGNDYFGNASQPLTEVGFDPASVKASAQCADQRLVELGIQIRRGQTTGSAESFLVTYISDGRERTVMIPFGMTLCEARDAAVPYCSASAPLD